MYSGTLRPGADPEEGWTLPKLNGVYIAGKKRIILFSKSSLVCLTFCLDLLSAFSIQAVVIFKASLSQWDRR